MFFRAISDGPNGGRGSCGRWPAPSHARPRPCRGCPPSRYACGRPRARAGGTPCGAVGRRGDRSRGSHRANQLGHDLDLQTRAFRARSNRSPSGPSAGPVIRVTSSPWRWCKPLDRQQGVLLRPAEDQPGDDVDDSHRGGPGLGEVPTVPRRRAPSLDREPGGIWVGKASPAAEYMPQASTDRGRRSFAHSVAGSVRPNPMSGANLGRLRHAGPPGDSQYV